MVRCEEGKVAFRMPPENLLMETLDGRSGDDKRKEWRRLSKEQDEKDEEVLRDVKRYREMMTTNELRGEGTNQRLGIGLVCSRCATHATISL